MIAATVPTSPNPTQLRPPASLRTDLSDWPGAGAVDLATHDLPHASSTLEWWYVNAHVETESGRDLSMFASFFEPPCIATRQLASTCMRMRSPGRWSIRSREAMPASHWSIVMRRVSRSTGSIAVLAVEDPLLRRAMREVLARNDVPRPDVLLNSACEVQ